MSKTFYASKVCLNVCVVLSTVFLLVTITSGLLVGIMTDGSLIAALLGVDWRSIIGFELIFFASILLSGILVAIYLLIFVSIQHFFAKSFTAGRPGVIKNRSLFRTRSFKYLVAVFLLPMVALFFLRTLSLFFPINVVHGSGQLNSNTTNVASQPVNLGANINTLYREAEPSFTADGQTMYFNCNNIDICVSQHTGTWESGNWSKPTRLGAPINTEYEDIEPVINQAGDQLYFTSNRPTGILKNIPFLSPMVNIFRVVNTMIANNSGHTLVGGLGMDDIWVTSFVNGVWTEPRNINDLTGKPHINTSYDDHCLFFSADGKEAYWTSTRPGGFGSDDIWASTLVDGSWTDPVNLGPYINGPGSEHSPIPTPDEQTLYITSNKPGGFGGEDIYISTRMNNGQWGALVNLGDAVNGPGDDRCAAWTPDLKIFLFDSTRSSGSGGRDIWWIDFSKVLGHPNS